MFGALQKKVITRRPPYPKQILYQNMQPSVGASHIYWTVAMLASEEAQSRLLIQTPQGRSLPKSAHDQSTEAKDDPPSWPVASVDDWRL